MPNRTKQIGVRLTDQEAEFLATLKVENAVTPSDKLRAIIDEARQRHRGTEDYAGSLKLVQDLVAPSARIVRQSENEQRMHSELVTRLEEWAPECMAYLLASNGRNTALDKKQLVEIEAAIVQRVIVLMTSVLQLAVTRTAPLYDGRALDKSIEPVLELARVIDTVRKQNN
ncbi:MAG: hypothetical protein AAGI27_01830 [Pseudomonadota bacterium]